ncbi:class I SAM-dependent DNA methyltransferase [Actinocorallia sp. A-T 12471]|uniref:class I SAM-dependent DNA methyltransferase n=1 Tax=Actinocorallia sp. A-T 12471 TaxID=3089813 RepID=UPI0029CF267D|nr:class I SAM-dependent DNA methyltransferase [Actinocorallia sp. A-T 12471]MDX6738702.1 class I SAM-dependent DNA methyltransferase [Actinocorallia sp. A-T 12471]
MEQRSDSGDLVQKLWSYCELLRHSGVSTLDYVEQLTYLLFLKIADERANRPLNPERIIPEGMDWASLVNKSGDDLLDQYEHILPLLGRQHGMLGSIFDGAKNKIQSPAVLQRLVKDLIGQYHWGSESTDVKGDAYEGLLQRGAEDRKTGAGQYFTPRPVIDAMVECVDPGPTDTVFDPACGTGGFLIAAHSHIVRHHGSELDSDRRRALNSGAIQGVELVRETARLASMNMLIHGIGQPNGEELIDVRDSLAAPPAKRFDVILANPPFGVGTVTGENYAKARQDLWTETTNKQLNFVQHIYTLLNMDGRAAVVLPDNVLFESGAGETIRRELLTRCDVHTLLRLPTGIFYAGGVKANVLFFDKKRPRPDGSPRTKRLWVYDLRTGQNFTMKRSPLTRAHLDDFVKCYRPGDQGARFEVDRFKAYEYGDLIARDKVNLDLTFLQDSATEVLQDPDVIAQEIVEELEAALAEFSVIAESLRALKSSREDSDIQD